MKRVYLLILALMASANIINAQVTKELYIEEGGFEWYHISNDDYEGAEDRNHKVLIPLSKKYTNVDYNDGYFIVEYDYDYEGLYNLTGKELISVKRKYESVMPVDDFILVEIDNYEGACDLTGKEIISPKRGYDKVNKIDNHYIVEKNGKEGACDLNGKEIVPTSYNGLIFTSGIFKAQAVDGKYYPLNVVNSIENPPAGEPARR